VSFARGLNDTPKIAALLLVVPVVGSFGSVGMVALIIACGGFISARRVAETMSRKITPMNHGQGFTANLVTGIIVIGASRLGMPVSTTHVSCGALFGIGTITRQARWGMIGKILAAWLTTLPLGAALGAIGHWLVSAF
jgi:inorganic phosphate transporter, PiT family